MQKAGRWLVAAAGVICVAFFVAGARSAASGKGAPAGPPTYTREVARILFDNCASCHRPGEVAPFSLLAYSDAKKRAKQIAYVAERRIMPPWKAAPGYGEFHDEMRLTTDQIDTLKRWADSGAPQGNPGDLPSPPRFPAGWRLGEPDAVFQPSEPYTLAAEGRDVYQCFVIPTRFAEDRWVSAMEVRPGNRSVVHHVIAFLDTTGQARRMDEASSEPGYPTFGGIGFLPSGTLGGWAPGNFPRHLPDDVGMLLPKGADIVLQVHYHKSGKVEKDQTRIGLFFSKKPVDKQLRIVPVINPFLNIAPGEKNHVMRATLPIVVDSTILQVMPHMHLLGREMNVKAVLPDGSEVPMVRIPDWDFNWQNTYTFRKPVKLPRGSRVELTARYDNSEENPRNPSRPPTRVTWGEQTTDEMCIAFLFGTIDAEHLTRGQSAAGGFRSLGLRRSRPSQTP